MKIKVFSRNAAYAIVLLLACAAVFAGGSQPKVVNGGQTQNEPATGALLVSPEPGASPPTYAGICTGTLIGCRTFLTAAHCVCSGNSNAKGALTSNCKTRPAKQLLVYLQNSGIHQVSSVKVNPKFRFGRASDISVLTLSEPVEGIPPAPLNTAGTPPFGTPGTVVGYGWTSGNGGDFGLKRSGDIVTGDCSDAAIPQPDNLCRQYSGAASATCYGDSGGPMFIGQAPNRVLAGVTSGVFDNCERNSYSFDSNVFQNSRFIQASIAQALDETGACRADLRQRLKKYVGGVYDASRQCIESALAGKTAVAGCLSQAARRIASAGKIFDAKQLAARCPDAIIGKSRFDACGAVTTVDGLGQCLAGVGNQAALRMLDLQFADSAAGNVLADRVLADCQKAVASAAKSYFFKSLNAYNQCAAKIDKGLLPVSDCAANAASSVAHFAQSLDKAILDACPDTAVAGLAGGSPFGGKCADATDTAGLIQCQRDENSDIAASLARVATRLPETDSEPGCGVVSQVGGLENPAKVIQYTRNQGASIPSAHALLHTFDVQEDDYRFMVVTLNGNETFLPVAKRGAIAVDNSLDLYLGYQRTPTLAPLSADAMSVNTGVFEAIRIERPAIGEWRLLVHDAGAVASVPYQLTITLYK